jgi:L-ascorbate metabolism protein UlaG (beta-lactamase superfamily)
MIITYQGLESIKIQYGENVVAFNPISKKSKHSSNSFGSDIVLITANHPDLNGVDTATRNDKVPFVISGPGEYEVNGLFVRGFETKTEYDEKERINTIYTLTIDNINIAYLGALNQTDFSPEIKEELGEADVLFVPIGGQGVLEASDAYKVAVKREPKVIIPIHYGTIGDKDALKNFLKEGGQESTKPVDKLTIKRKDIESLQGEIVVLSV